MTSRSGFRTIRRLAAWTTLLSAIACCSPSLDRRLDHYMQAHERNGFSGSVLVAQDTTVTFVRGYGLANRERNIANSAETVFPFGSIVKDYTRLVVLELELDGALSRGHSLVDYLDDVPADKRGITIQHLLTHTSGLAAYHDPGVEGIPPDHAPMTREAALNTILGQALNDTPGKTYHYSNSGYTLLAMIIEAVTGRPFAEVVEARVLEPAGMTRSGFYRDPKWSPDDVAVGYGPVSHGEENSPAFWPTQAWPVAGNGGMAGPLIDLLRGAHYIERRRAASPEFDRAWVASTADDEPREFHASAGGNDFGFVTVLFLWPERGCGMALASNNDGNGREDPQMILDLVQIAFGLTPADLGFEAHAATGRIEPDELDAIPSAPRVWGLPDRGSWRRASAFLDAIASSDTSRWRRLILDATTPRFRKTLSLDQHLEQFRAMHDLLAMPEVEGAERENQIHLMLRVRSFRSAGVCKVYLDLEPQAPFRIDAIRIES